MSQPIVQVDAFTHEPFSGNPAAVCVMDQAADESWMQRVAREMNVSETAFLHPEGECYRLRWFTPVAEVELCGHATLASAHVLWDEGHLPTDRQARFITASGELSAALLPDPGQWIELDFPATPAKPAEPPDGLLQALGVTSSFYGQTRFDAFVELPSEQAVRELHPDIPALKKVPLRGTIVTAPGDGEHDVVSRFFCPTLGVDEDPVTGSAHCAIGPHFRSRLAKDELRCFQASARGGELRLRVTDERVYIAGQAVTVLRGQLL